MARRLSLLLTLIVAPGGFIVLGVLVFAFLLARSRRARGLTNAVFPDRCLPQAAGFKLQARA